MYHDFGLEPESDLFDPLAETPTQNPIQAGGAAVRSSFLSVESIHGRGLDV